MASCNASVIRPEEDASVGENAFNTISLLLFFSLIDHSVLKPWIAQRLSPESKDVCTTRWFFIHSFANLLVVISSINSIRAVLSDPVHAFDGAIWSDRSFFGEISKWPLTIINAVHIYHMIGGFKLGPADYFHHCIFIPTISFPGQIYRWGPLSNWQAFFISGLPGGVDYLMLGLQKLGKLEGMTEKRVNANLNTYLRCPGILAATVLCYQAVLLGHTGANLPMGVRPPWWAVGFQLILSPFNAVYFGKQAVANYAVHYMLNLLGQDELIKTRIEQRTSKTTGTEVMSWKDAIGVPQRGS